MNKKYFESKKGSVEEKINTIASEQPTISASYTPNVKLSVEKKYFETKPGSLTDAASKVVSEGLDKVNPVAVKKKFDDRKDKDIDNDGDTDSTDKYLHKRRAAISKAIKNEELGKEDEKPIKDVVKGLKKAIATHTKQAADLTKALKNEGNVGVRPDDKGEIINKKKHDAYGNPKTGEAKPVDPEPKIGQVIKGEKETTRANGHMTKKKFSEMRIKLGKNGKTDTGQDAAAVETEPKAERI